MNTKENHKSKHTTYSEKLVSLIEESSLEHQNLMIEQTYGEYMDFENFQHIKGEEYGDLDIFIQTEQGGLYIEVKTNPSEKDLTSSKQQMAKAAYLLEQVEYTISLTDSEIDLLTPKEISKWDFQEPGFEPDLQHLTLKDAQKTHPKEHESINHENSPDSSDFHIENGDPWKTDKVPTENLPNQWPRHRHLTIQTF